MHIQKNKLCCLSYNSVYIYIHTPSYILNVFIDFEVKKGKNSISFVDRCYTYYAVFRDISLCVCVKK